MAAWHTKEWKAVVADLQTSAGGLTVGEAARRLEADGPNALPAPPVDTLFDIFIQQFKSPLIYVLLLASVAIFAIGETVDGMILLVVLLFNAIVGTIQEGRAQNTLAALKRFAATNATVWRDGLELVIPDHEVVVGDILVLRGGDKVAADARMIDAVGLKVDEAALTGESEPVAKSVEPVVERAVPADQRDMVFKGTNVVSGLGRAVVVAIGTNTVLGSIARNMSAAKAEIPLQASIRRLSRAIIVVVIFIGVFLFAVGFAEGRELVELFSTAVSLAISVIPEGLPVVITLVLSTGVWRMTKRNALVKKLQAVEALGHARVIAVDKTGTLTKNEMVVREAWAEGMLFTLGGAGYEPSGSVELSGEAIDAANHPELLRLGRAAAFSADARVYFSEKEEQWLSTGDPTEAAIFAFGEKVVFKRDDLLHEASVIADMPFDFSRNYHAITVREGNQATLFVSGSPEAVLALATRIYRNDTTAPLRQSDRDEISEVIADLSSRGLRVVALASRGRFSGALEPEQVKGITLLGLLGMRDPLRDEAAESVAAARAAGIKVVMITGDHKLTARAVAREAGIWRDGNEILTGADIDMMLDPELAARVRGVSVFARVTPEHKLRIVQAYRARGETVAMTGDGVNDAPSLVAANLGVAMGGIGTEVAKEAADIVLLDDNFATIVAAIEEGRNIYKTIQKVILYLFSTNLGEVLTITIALIIGLPLPLLAAQIIWLNLVTDGFLDVALAMEPKERGLLSGAFPKPRRYIVNGAMATRIILMAITMAIGTLVLFYFELKGGRAHALTISLTALAVFQWFNAWNCRSDRVSILSHSWFTNPYLIGATALVVGLQLLAVYTPFLQSVLRTVPLTFTDWAIIIPVGASVILVEEIRKFFARRIHKRASTKASVS